MNLKRTGSILAGAAALSLGALGLSAGPSFGADSGTVTVSVTAAQAPAPCISIDVSSIDFGTLAFSIAGADNTVLKTGAAELTNCGTVATNWFAKATDFTNAGQTVTWDLTEQSPSCSQGIDKARLQLRATNLNNSDALIRGAASPGTVDNVSSQLTMPCTGSSGAGEAMSSDITVTAVTS